MSNDKTYEKVIQALRDVKPMPAHSDRLTMHIMDRLNKEQLQNKRSAFILYKPQYWAIFIGFRTAMAVAAALLVGFFIFQQWEIMSKVSSLEDQMRKQTYKSKDVESYKAIRLKEIIEQQLQVKTTSVNDESITINSRSWNNLIQAFEQLNEENKRLKEKIIRQFADTLKSSQNEKAPCKSL